MFDLGNNEVDQQINQTVLTIIIIILISAGLFAEIENGANALDYMETVEGSGEWSMRYDEEYTKHFFHDGIYFVIVTLTTVGYGEMGATRPEGEVLCLFILLTTMIYVPSQTTELLRLINIKSKYRTAVYPGSESQHVVITGYIAIEAIRNFCEELFHEEHNTGSS